MDMNEGKKALVIAVSEYVNDLRPLPFCKNDGKDMMELLRNLGYDVVEENLIGRVDGTLMKNCIYDFFGDEKIKQTDTLLFYFSGHGVASRSGEVHLASSNISITNPKKFGFSFSELTELINDCFSNKLITILDCCHAGKFGLGKGDEDEKSMLAQVTKSVAKSTKEIRSGSGKCLLSASQGMQEAFATKKENYSFFTSYLLEGLKGANGKSVDQDGVVTPGKLMEYIDEEINKLPNEEKPYQTPIRKIEAEGRLVLAIHENLAPKSTSVLSEKQVDELLESEDIDEMKKQLRILLGRQKKILEDPSGEQNNNKVLDKEFLKIKKEKEEIGERLEELGHVPEIDEQLSLREANLFLEAEKIVEANSLINKVLKVNPKSSEVKKMKEIIHNKIKEICEDKRSWKIKKIDCESFDEGIENLFHGKYDFKWITKYKSEDNRFQDIQLEMSNFRTKLMGVYGMNSKLNIMFEIDENLLSIYLTKDIPSKKNRISMSILSYGVPLVANKVRDKMITKDFWNYMESKIKNLNMG